MTGRGSAQSKADIRGYIINLAVENIQVGLAQKRKLEQFANIDRRSRYSQDDPTFKARLIYGKRLEPWLVEVVPMVQ